MGVRQVLRRHEIPSRRVRSSTVYHILYFCDQLYAVKKQVLKQCLSDISLVRTKFPLDIVKEPALFQRLTVIHVSGGKHEIQYFSFVIDYQVRLESEEPPHGAFAPLGKSFESFMNEYALVTAYAQRGRIHEANAGACTEQYLLDEDGQRKQDSIPSTSSLLLSTSITMKS